MDLRYHYGDVLVVVGLVVSGSLSMVDVESHRDMGIQSA